MPSRNEIQGVSQFPSCIDLTAGEPSGSESCVDLMTDVDSDDLSGDELAMQQSIENSIVDIVDRATEQPSLADVLKAHALKYLTTDDDLTGKRQDITIRRKHVWYDTKRVMQRASFKSHVGLEVNFLNEDAQDAGGPLREYFRLLWKEVAADGSIFAGPAGKLHLRHNTMAIRSKKFSLVGRCIGLSLLYGGGGPHFLSDAVVSYLLDEPFDDLEPEEVEDLLIREQIVKISQCESTFELREALDSEEAEFRFDAGVCMPSRSVEIRDKYAIVQDLVSHFLIHASRSELDQLRQGCSELGVLSLLRSHPTLLRPLLVSSGKPILTARSVAASFHVKWSPLGSNTREDEEGVVMGWREYLDGVEEGRLVLGEDPEVDDVFITLETVFAFATGGDHEPPQGFENTPQIQFESRRTRFMPTACTCFPSLTLPIVLTDPDMFRCRMDEAIINGRGFGNP